MGLPSGPVTLSLEQVDQLNRRLADTRHDINNHLAHITAALELIRLKPAEADRMLAAMADRPHKISQALATFSQEFERLFAIVRTPPQPPKPGS